jgi:hypothetical protein
MIGALGLAISPPSATAAPSSPGGIIEAFWPFNGRAADASGNHNDGQAVGATLTSDRFGLPGSAYSFDGTDDDIGLSNSPSLQIGLSDYTIVAWIKTTEPTNNGRIFSKGSWDCTTGYMMRLTGDVVHLENALNGTCLVFLDGSRDVADGNWHFVVGVVSRATGAKIYVDGALDAAQSINTSGDDLSNDRSPTIGRSDAPANLAPTEFFNGSIDDEWIYSKALSSSDVLAMYNHDRVAPTIAGSYAMTLTASTGTVNHYSLTVNADGTWSIVGGTGSNAIVARGTVTWDGANADWFFSQSLPAVSSHFTATSSSGALTGSWFPTGGAVQIFHAVPLL